MAKKWTSEEFEAYVRRLEPEAQKNPSGYRQKILGWIALGYGYLALLISGTLALLALIVGVMITGRFSRGLIQIGIFLLIFAFTLLRSLWIKVHEPEGIPLTREDAPQLFEMVERLRQKTEAPPFAKLLLTTDFNAAAAQIPRLGVFGWPKNYLIVGLPLMQALSPQEFESVIAHELGHLRSGHGNFGSKVYRVFQTWGQLAETGTGLLSSFAHWYFPHLNAYTFPLRRQNEYEADKIAAEAVGARVAADALCGIHVWGEVLNKNLWEPLSKRLHLETEAPRHIFQEQGRVLRQEPIAPELATRAIRDAMLEDTTFVDSHPALKDRLVAMGQEARVPEKPAVSAAEAFFGNNLSRLTEMLDGIWYRAASQGWRQGHEQAVAERNKFEVLATRLSNGAVLTDEEAYQYASGVEKYGSEDAALPLYRALFEAKEYGNPARMDVGRILIQRDDPEGAALLEELTKRWPLAAGHALGLLHAYHKRLGDESAARQAYTRALRHGDQVEEWQQELTQLTPKDTLLPHGLSSEKVIELRETLAKFDELGKAYLVQKQVANFTQDTEFLILAIQLKKKVRLNEESDYQKLHAALDEAVPMVVIALYGNFTWLRKRVETIPEALIYAA